MEMAESGEEFSADSGWRSRIWFSIVLVFSFRLEKSFGEEEKDRMAPKDALCGWNCRHTAGNTFARTCMEKGFIAAMGAGAAARMRHAERETRRKKPGLRLIARQL